MFKGYALLYAAVFILLGILGFIPFLVSEGYLFHFFKVNAATNLVHLGIGLGALWALFLHDYYTRLYFQIVGFILAILAVFGFIYEKTPILSFIANNPPLTWLHLIAALWAFIVGYSNHGVKGKKQ